MTDAEIVKALECCSNDDIDCEECPAFSCCESDIFCVSGAILDLINRQKAEIEKYENIKTTIDKFWDILLKIKFAKRKESPTLEELADALAKMQTEAIKEFAERLKNQYPFRDKYHEHTIMCLDIFRDSIDNLVKEMTE